jgi:hypothetical protein
MAEVLAFPAGGYRFLDGPFQFSLGVAAEPGFEIERARFPRPVQLEEGFRVIEAHLEALGRPPTAICACELRSPAPFTDAGFTDFNRLYVRTLEAWGVYRDGVNPVARSNVCPEVAPPATPSFYAFSYTVPARRGRKGSFVIAGAAEAREGTGSYRERIVRFGDTSPEGLREKARWVLGALEQRMEALGAGWHDATATQLYTVYDPYPFLVDEIAARGAMAAGLTWHVARPPVIGLDYEMDVRGVATERAISV